MMMDKTNEDSCCQIGGLKIFQGTLWMEDSHNDLGKFPTTGSATNQSEIFVSKEVGIFSDERGVFPTIKSVDDGTVVSLKSITTTDWKVAVISGINGLPKVRLENSNDLSTSCEVYLFGATLTSWVSNGRERIFVSEKAVFDGTKAIRGGVPLVFPQFAQPNKDMPQHGFARIQNWELKSSSVDHETAEVVLSLNSTPLSMQMWPHNIEMIYNVSLTRTTLSCSLQAKNVDGSDFACQALLHTYLRVPDIASVRVTGLNGLSYFDKVTGASTTEEREIVDIVGEVDRVYNFKPAGDSQDVHLFYRETSILKPACIGEDGTSINIRIQAFVDQENTGGPRGVVPDVVVWNPHTAKARSMADLGEEAFPYFVCIEPGVVADWKTLQPGDTLILSQELTARDF